MRLDVPGFPVVLLSCGNCVYGVNDRRRSAILVDSIVQICAANSASLCFIQMGKIAGMRAVLFAAPLKFVLVCFAYILLSVHKVSDDIDICELVREPMQRVLPARHHACTSVSPAVDDVVS